MKTFYEALISLGVEENEAKDAYEDYIEMVEKGVNPSNYWECIGTGSFKECYFIGNTAVKFATLANDTYRREECAYNKALDAGLEQIFARTIFIPITSTSIPSYFINFDEDDGYASFDYVVIQEKVDKLLSRHEDNTARDEWACLVDEKGIELDNDIYYKLTQCITPYTNWLQAGINHYGLNFMVDLANFIKDQYIDDLHGGNIGFRADGSPVIFDFIS